MPTKPPFLLIGLGELLWDCFGDERKPGGAPANVAFHANQLGMKSIVASRVGHDDLGNELRSFLEDHGLDTTCLQTDSQHPTGTVTVDMPKPDHPQYTIHTDVAWDHLAFDAPLQAACKQANAICFGTLAQRSPQTRATIQQCVSATTNALVVYDVNLRAPFYDRETIEASLHSCHIAKFNDQEAEVLAAMLDLSGDNAKQDALQATATHMRTRYNLRAVCITRGGQGCLLETESQQVTATSKPITVADTVGAGDAFSAALTLACLNDWPPAATANFANQFAAEVASQPGAMPTISQERINQIQRESPSGHPSSDHPQSNC